MKTMRMFLVAAALAGPLCWAARPAAAAGAEVVEVSAPILPRVSVLYPAEGNNFPASTADRATLAHDAALTFDFLMAACSMNHSGIVIPGPTDPPNTPAQNATNLETVANCAYTDFVSKPYWIPALVDQVDICGTELGSSWHLITEADVNDVTDADAQAMATALSTPNSTTFFGNFYFSLHVWVRATDGSLARADLSPGVTARMSTLPVSASSTTHYESDMALRCIRRTPVAP